MFQKRVNQVIEKMKTDYFEKVSNHEKQEGVCTQM